MTHTELLAGSVEIADAHPALDLSLLDADGQAGRRAESHVRKSQAPGLGEEDGFAY